MERATSADYVDPDYEFIQAPKFFDFGADQAGNDEAAEAWFDTTEDQLMSREFSVGSRDGFLPNSPIVRYEHSTIRSQYVSA